MRKIIFAIIALTTLFSCEKPTGENVRETNSERLVVNRSQLLNLSKTKGELSAFEKIQEENSFTPLINLHSKKLKGSNQTTSIRSSNKEAFLSLFNEDHVFQFEETIVYLKDGYELGDEIVISLLDTDKYDNFIKDNPLKKLELPTRILKGTFTIKKGFNKLLSRSKNNKAKVARCADCDDLVDQWACGLCMFGAIAIVSGCPAGVLEVAACASCYISLKKYADCVDRSGTW